MSSGHKRPNLGRACALMPLWVMLIIMFTGSVSRDSEAYRSLVALELFLVGWGFGLGRAALATGYSEGRGTPIAGLVLNVIFWLALAGGVIKPTLAPSQVQVLDNQKGRASDR